MSIEWVLAVVVAAQAGLLGFYIKHIIDCNRRDLTRAIENLHISTTLATITESLRRVQLDIGDHGSGLRGQVHKLASDITPYVIREQMKRGE